MSSLKHLRSRSIHPMKIMICFSAVMTMVAIANIFYNMHRGTRMIATAATSFLRRQGWTEQSITDWTMPFCQSWDASDANNRSLQPFDLWYTHHPNWIVTSETEDEFCVGVVIVDKSPIIRNMMHFYANQFMSSCQLVHTRYQWCSGWSADFWNINLGLIHALYYRVPCIITSWEPDNPNIGIELTHPWHYAADKKYYGQANQPSLVCKAGDTTCYFLPYHGCGPIDELKNDSSIKLLQDVEDKGDDGSSVNDDMGWAAYLFVTRKQLWLRRAVFDYREHFKRTNNWSDKSDCTVMHVRRSDVAGDRYYYPVAYYVEMIPEEKLVDPNHYVFLLTDDMGAIEEAHEFFPHLNWKYFDRPRHNGSSGGWENQTPSGDPALEVIVILSLFDLVQDCSTLVHGPSGFTNYMYEYMVRDGKRSNIKKYDVQNAASATRLHAVPLNESEAFFYKILDEMRTKNKTKAVKVMKENHQQKCPDDEDRIIIVNMLGRLANNLFELAFAKRIAEQLGCQWQVVYRSGWAPTFSTELTDKCFPYALARNNNRQVGSADKIQQAIRNIDTTNASSVPILSNALGYNFLEPEKHQNWNIDPFSNTVIDNDDPGNITITWINALGETAFQWVHMGHPFHGDHVDMIVTKLRDQSSPVRVLYLSAFFIHFDWMRDWMDQIGNWLYIEPSCCKSPLPSGDTIVIHIRDFEKDDGLNNYLQVGVYRDIIDEYADGNRGLKVTVVCQHDSVNSGIVQDIVKEFEATVYTGEDAIDAFCILSSAKNIFIASTSSTFSQMAALLASQKNADVQIHYPIHTLDYPAVTLNVTSWKYHLTNADNSGVAEFDVDHQRIKFNLAA